MSQRTKNILRNIGFVLSIPILIGAFVFAVSEEKRARVQAIEVEILNPELNFVTTQDIKQSLLDENLVMDHTLLESLNITELENKMNANPWIEHAEVFATSQRNVKVSLLQSVPKLRVQRTDSSAHGFYLNDDGATIPLSIQYTADVPILTTERKITKIEQRKELVSFAQYIEKDTFWSAVISQINLDANNDIELSSLIGHANIRFGSTENKEDKFFRLFQFYKKGINRINWANVKELDLRFDKQLVCRRYHKEKHIEESRAPKLYVKKRTKLAVQKKKVVSKTSKVEEKTISKPKPKFEAPVRRKVVTKNVWKNKESSTVSKSKKTAKAKKVRKTQPKEKKLVTKRVIKTKKKTPKKKLAAKKKKAPSKPTVRTASKSSKPKVKKKKKEIIINTEPITVKTK